MARPRQRSRQRPTIGAATAAAAGGVPGRTEPLRLPAPPAHMISFPRRRGRINRPCARLPSYSVAFKNAAGARAGVSAGAM
jgi:hypothetical protein